MLKHRTMKKFLLLIALVVGAFTTAQARDTYAHDASVLPEAARTTIVNNFKAGVSVVKIDKDFGRISEYDVVLDDGTEIGFDRNGNWDKVEVNNTKSVPASIIPTSIRTTVAKLQPKQRIVGIEKERRGYDVKLSNGVEMKFDRDGKFIRYDD